MEANNNNNKILCLIVLFLAQLVKKKRARIIRSSPGKQSLTINFNGNFPTYQNSLEITHIHF